MTGVNIVPSSQWTLHIQGAKQVPITGIDDKRQVTVVMGNTATGTLLPPQVIYQGKTTKCHPTFKFPSDWDITHSPNHWANEETTLQYVEAILVPYFTAQRAALDLDPTHPGLLLMDVFAAHRTDKVKKLLAHHNIIYIFIPANCTGELQPLDVSGNGNFKESLKSSFSEWYSDEVTKQLKEGREHSKVGLQLTILKPLHANWLLQAWESLSNHPKHSVTGWRKAGLLEAVQ
jgi:hypothetical protein